MRAETFPRSGKLPTLIGTLLLLSFVLYGCGETSEGSQESAKSDGTTQNTESGSKNSDNNSNTNSNANGARGSTENTSGGSGKGGQGKQDKPQAVKGLYVPGSAASGQELDDLLKVADKTEANALVVDVKEGGYTTYPSEVPLAQEIGATTEQIPDLEKLVQKLEDRDIYTIARLSAFQDDVLPRERPNLAVMDTATGGPWQTYQGGT